MIFFKMKTKYLNNSYIILAASILVLIYAYLLPNFSFFQNLYNSQNGDLFLRWRHKHNPRQEIIDRFVIVDIDEETLARLNQRWPIKRDVYASFLKQISGRQDRPAIIGLDILFAGKSENPEADLLFANALKESANVIIASYFDDRDRLILPDKIFLESAKAVGFVNYPRDNDLTVRRAYPLKYPDKDEPYYSFALEILSAIGGGFSIPFDRKNYTARINYFAKFNDFKVVPLWRILESKAPESLCKDKIVLVGNAKEIYHDIHPTPLGLMPGLGINANFLMSVLSGRTLKATPKIINFPLLFVISLLIIFVTYKLGNLKGLILSVAVIISGFYASTVCISRDIIFDFLGIVFIALFSFLAIIMLKYLSTIIENTLLRKLAVTDGLTGLYVLRYFEVKLNSEINTAITKKDGLSLAIFDIDYFKKINDTYGHDAGNEILKKVASIMKNRSRKTDTLVRFGGEEFAAILPQTNAEGAGRYAEIIRKAIESCDFVYQDKILKVTVSAGTSSLPDSKNASAQELLKTADTALYEAKTSGRNKVVGAA